MEQLFADLLDVSADHLFILDRQGHVVFANQAFRRTWGLSNERSELPLIEHLIHQDDLSVWQRCWDGLQQESTFVMTARSLMADESWASVRWHLCQPPHHIYILGRADVLDVLPNAKNKVDRDTRAQLENAADMLAKLSSKDLRNFLQKIVNTIPCVLYIFDIANNRSVFVNRRMYDILGYTADEFYRFGSFIIPQLVHPDDNARVTHLIERQLAGRDTEVFDVELRMQHKDRHWVWIRYFSTVFKRGTRGQATEVLGVALDVSHQKEAIANLERERMKSVHHAKMATLGEMAGGMAHEINNPLAIIKGLNAQARKLLRQPESNIATLASHMDKIDRTCDRIAAIIRGLQNFSRSGERDPFVETPIITIIESTLELCRERFRLATIDLRLSLEPNLFVVCSRAQLSQAILNLLSNAFDALSDTEATSKWIAIESRGSGQRALIAITDSGPGIPSYLHDRIMEPFFTTKELGRGTGLGLSIAKGIVEAHSGSLHLDTTTAHTRFVIHLPRQRPVETASFKRPAPYESPT